MLLLYSHIDPETKQTFSQKDITTTKLFLNTTAETLILPPPTNYRVLSKNRMKTRVSIVCTEQITRLSYTTSCIRYDMITYFTSSTANTHCYIINYEVKCTSLVKTTNDQRGVLHERAIVLPYLLRNLPYAETAFGDGFGSKLVTATSFSSFAGFSDSQYHLRQT